MTKHLTILCCDAPAHWREEVLRLKQRITNPVEVISSWRDTPMRGSAVVHICLMHTRDMGRELGFVPEDAPFVYLITPAEAAAHPGYWPSMLGRDPCATLVLDRSSPESQWQFQQRILDIMATRTL